MLKNYLKIALRNLLKNRVNSAINIAGLVIGITSCIVILLFVQYELSYDEYHEKGGRIYRLIEAHEDVTTTVVPTLPFPAGPTLELEYPNLVEETVRFFNYNAYELGLKYGDKKFSEDDLFFTDGEVFDVFDFELIEGSPDEALAQPNRMVITESTAKKYFGNENPIGKVLQYEGEHDVVITGIAKDVKPNSHFKWNALISVSTLEPVMGRRMRENWYWNPVWTYVLMKEGANPEELRAQFPYFVQKYFYEDIRDFTTVDMQNLHDIHLHSNLEFEIEANGSFTYVIIFAAVAVLILLIACINYINLSTARSAKRAREVGLRKVLGADRKELVKQFIGESVILTTISIILSAAMVEVLLPYFNGVANLNLSLNLPGNTTLLMVLLGIVLVVGVLSGLYPAVFLSSFQPVKVLKSDITMRGGKSLLRESLVVVQFAISIILIIGTITVFNQLEYLRTKDIGFDKEEVIYIPTYRTSMPDKYQSFKEQVEQNSDIISMTFVEEILGAKNNMGSYTLPGESESRIFARMMVRDDFIETFGMEVIAGRANDSEKYPTDESDGLLVNEAMLKVMGIDDPQEAIGLPMDEMRKRIIIGVVKDFNFSSLHRPVAPFVINPRGVSSFFNRFVAVRVNTANLNRTLSYLEDKWDIFIPEKSFSYFFLDDKLDNLYRAEQNLASIIGVFSYMAIFIACLGLFGLISYTAEQRTKEIGIRKVLGASVSSILLLISKEFLRLVIIANIVAIPAAYFISKEWLSGFAYQTAISPLTFVIGAAAAFLIAIVTVSWQAVKAANANPVKSLRYE